MSGSAESTPHAPDPFAVILGQALLLHQDQMHSEYKNRIEYTNEWVVSHSLPLCTSG